MKIKVQACLGGNNSYYFRALVCGGLLVRGATWSRKIASEMLDLIATKAGIARHKIRFRHV